MAYEISWLDKQNRVLRAALRGSIAPTEVSELRRTIRPIAEDPAPVYVLLNIETLNLSDAPMRLLAAFDGIQTDTIRHHLDISRIAIVGGGYAISSLIQLYSSIYSGSNPTRLFDDEAVALEWLQSQIAEPAT